MFGKSITLFKLFGFAVRIDPSWFIIVLLVTWSLADGVFPYYYKDLSTQTYWWMGLVGALGLFVSIVLHELSHSLVARHHGVEMRGITLFIFGGVAEMTDEPPSAKAEFLVAIAGPIASVIISAACFGLYRLGTQQDWITPVLGVLFYLAFINAILVAFNLVPAFPLDGGRVLRSILWQAKGNLRWATRITSQIGSGFGMFLIILGVFSVIFGNFIGGMWWFLLGMFLRGAANMSYKQLLLRRSLEGEPVSKFMVSDVQTVPADVSVREFVDEYVYKHHFKMFPVTENGTMTGCVTTRRVKELPHEEWDDRTVGDVAEPCSENNSISAGADAMDAFAKMSQSGMSRLLVVEDGEVRGIITLKDLLRFISLKVELDEG